MSKSNKASIKRRRQFEAYSKNLETFFPDLVGKFLCPLCRRLFSVEDLENKIITSEHIIPKAVKGKLTTLTCSTCNNEAGRNLDIQLLNRLQVEDVFSGKSSKPLRGKIKVGEGEQTVDLNITFEDKPYLDLIGLPKYSNPSLQVKAIQEFERAKDKGIKFQVEFESYKKIPSYVAIIRSAYLMMFSFFGYGYILHPNLKIVFEQIQNFTIESNVLYGIVEIQGNELGANHVSVCQLSSGEYCFLPTLNFSTTTEDRHYSVIMPSLRDSSKSIYDKLKLLRESTTSELMVLETILFAPKLICYPFLPYQIWQKIGSVDN